MEGMGLDRLRSSSSAQEGPLALDSEDGVRQGPAGANAVLSVPLELAGIAAPGAAGGVAQKWGDVGPVWHPLLLVEGWLGDRAVGSAGVMICRWVVAARHALPVLWVHLRTMVTRRGLVDPQAFSPPRVGAKPTGPGKPPGFNFRGGGGGSIESGSPPRPRDQSR